MSQLTLHKERLLYWLQRPGCNISKTLEFARQEYLDDPDILLQAVQKDSQALIYATPRLQNDPKIVLAAVETRGSVLQYASPELQDHKPTVMAALRNDAQALQYASSRLKTDKKVVLDAVTRDGVALRYASQVLCNDEEVVLAAVKSTGLALEYASETRRNDKGVVLAAIQNRYRALQYASEELRNDRDIVLAAIKENDWALYYASPERQNDKDMILAMVKKNGQSLRYLHINPEFRQDRDIILAGVQQNGMALQYASEELRDDKHIVLIAVTQSGRSLQYASQRLKADRAVVVVAVQNSDQALQFASKELQQDTELTLIAAPRDDRGSKSPNPESKDSEFDASFLSFFRSSTLQSVINPQAGQIRDLKHQVAHLQEICDQLQQQFRTFIETSDSKELIETPVMPPITLVSQVDRYASLRQGESLYQRYITVHPDLIGQWITILDNDYTTGRAFKTPEAALKYYRGHKVRYCKQYTGPNTSMDRVFSAIETRFGGQETLDSRLAYVCATLINPEESKMREEVQFMIDTGATCCMGRKETLDTKLEITPLQIGETIVGSNQSLITIYVEVWVILKDATGRKLPRKLVRMGYYDPPPAKAYPEDWLLGQNFLRSCKHTWTPNQIEIRHPYPKRLSL